MLRLESQLPGSFRQQILVCGQVLAIPAQFERMRREVSRHIAERKLRILSDQAGKTKVPVQRQHLLVVVLQSLNNLYTQNQQNQSNRAGNTHKRDFSFSVVMQFLGFGCIYIKSVHEDGQPPNSSALRWR